MSQPASEAGAKPAPKFDPWFRNGLIRSAIGQALHEAMAVDPLIHLFGEGCSMKVHFDAPQIERDFPERVHTCPISEDCNTNFAVGASLLGVKAVVDVITSDFLYRTADALANTAAKLNSVLATGEPPRTMLVRAEFLTAGPTTGARPEATFAHIPGINVVVPSTPRAAYALTHAALKAPGVHLLFEDRMILDAETKETDKGPLTDTMPLGYAGLRRKAKNARLTIVTYGLMRQVVERALDEARVTLPLDLIDLRSLFPVDWDLLEGSVDKTNNLLVVEPDVEFGGIGAEIVATLAERRHLAKIRRLGGRRITLPAASAFHHLGMPTEQEILEAVNAFA